MTKTFYGNHYDKRSNKHEELTKALIYLCTDSDGMSSVISIDEKYSGEIDWNNEKKAIKYNCPILYEFDNVEEVFYRYTKLTYAEFDYILYSCIYDNKSGVDSILIFDLYFLLKFYITRNDAIRKQHGDNEPFQGRNRVC